MSDLSVTCAISNYAIMKGMKNIVTIAACIFLATSALAQTRVIHGRLTAFNTYPVQNVEIASKKGKSATISDSLGRFSIVCLENDVIRIKPKAFMPVSKRIGPDTDSLLVNLIFKDSKKNRDIAITYT